MCRADWDGPYGYGRMSDGNASIGELEKQLVMLREKLERCEFDRAAMEEERESERLHYEKMKADLAAARQQAGMALTELKAAQQQLIHAEKMASLGALTAGIAHEIKNPLNFVNNFAALARELVIELRGELAGRAEKEEFRGSEIEDVLRDLEMNTSKIEEHGRRADLIVRSMMQHARGGSGERERVDVNTLVGEYLDLAYHGKRAQTPDFNADLVRNLDADVGDLEIVPQDVGRVLINLIGNAFDAVHQRSRESDASYEPRVCVSTGMEGEWVEIRVTDNGPGIPEDVKAKIFEAFFTTKPTGAGTGLGLSMSHDIVTKGHGGTLRVESKVGEGTTFVVALPRQPK